MPESIVACDVDLRRVAAYSTRDGRVCSNAAEWPFDKILSHDVILVEVADARLTTTGSGGSNKKQRIQELNRRRWMIGNSFRIGQLYHAALVAGVLDRVRAATVQNWTGRIAEGVREAMAGVVGEDNHDIRACRCMLFFYQEDPRVWVPIHQHYNEDL